MNALPRLPFDVNPDRQFCADHAQDYDWDRSAKRHLPPTAFARYRDRTNAAKQALATIIKDAEHRREGAIAQAYLLCDAAVDIAWWEFEARSAGAYEQYNMIVAPARVAHDSETADEALGQYELHAVTGFYQYETILRPARLAHREAIRDAGQACDLAIEQAEQACAGITRPAKEIYAVISAHQFITQWEATHENP